MKRRLLRGWALLVHSVVRPAPRRRPISHRRQGCLVVAGGGPIPADVFRRALDLAGGRKAHVLVIPQASALSDTGVRVARLWRALGAARVSILDLEDPAHAARQVHLADLIWMAGGDQTRLIAALDAAGLTPVLHRRYEEGAVIAGTSAGAAVMSHVMIAGDPEPEHGRRLAPLTGAGLGLWPEVIVDQHFLRRNRIGRLRSAVLQQPELVGVGIDEETAVVVRGRHLEVIGSSRVVIVDARRRLVAGYHAREIEAGRAVALHVLNPGMQFHLDHGPDHDGSGHRVTA